MLPNLSSSRPTYTMILPTTQETIKYQPYTNKQSESILIAAQDDSYKTTIASLETLMNDCCGFVPENIVDFMAVITHINAKSHGESHSFVLKECECGHKNIEIRIDNIIDALKIKNQDKLSSVYELTPDISLKLGPTKIDMLKDIKFDDSVETAMEQVYSLIAHSVVAVMSGDKIIKDFSIEELKTSIVHEMTSKQTQDVNEAIGKLISIFVEATYTCPGCKETITKEISEFLI